MPNPMSKVCYIHFPFFDIYIKWPILFYTHFFLGSLVPSFSPSHKRRRREGEGGDLLINNSGILKPSFSPPVANGGGGGGKRRRRVFFLLSTSCICLRPILKLYHTVHIVGLVAVYLIGILLVAGTKLIYFPQK